MNRVFKYIRYNRRDILHPTLIVFIVLFFTSCISNSTLFQQVNQKTAPLNKTSELCSKQHLVLKINDSLMVTTEEPIVKKNSSYFLPMIIYWGWNQKFDVQMPQKYLINLFNNVLINKDKEFEYHKFFSDKTLEIELKKLPDHFIYSLSGTYWFLPYFAGLGLYYSHEKIYPENQEFVVKYRFFNSESNLKSGIKSLEMKFPRTEIYNPSSQNVSYYIDDFRKEFEYQAGKLIDMVIDDL
jgi:hypothetical protein